MKELQVKVRPKCEDICFFPEDFQKIKFLGLEIPNGTRYFRVNWGSTENNYAIWYPFVGGAGASLYANIRTECDINRLLKKDYKFFSFETGIEMYRWLGHSW
uniref:Uncharacterized protein n=1 Tax=viral metagenome TaxID=1070528 RepID=A0A6M3KD80_9ZZZZ